MLNKNRVLQIDSFLFFFFLHVLFRKYHKQWELVESNEGTVGTRLHSSIAYKMLEQHALSSLHTKEQLGKKSDSSVGWEEERAEQHVVLSCPLRLTTQW